MLSGDAHPVALLTLPPLVVFYEVVPTAVYGRTLGKWATGLKVVRAADGGDIGRGHAIGRSIVSGVLSLFPFIPIDHLVCLWDRPNRQTLHDKAARTIVIADRGHRRGEPAAVFG